MNGDKSKKTKVLIGPPKSECSIRKIPIPSEMLQLLVQVKRQNEAFLLTGMIHSYIEPMCMENRFKTVIDKCGVSQLNFHALRHTFATRCIELGFDIKSLSEILGHANVNITLNRYVHPSMDLKQANMNRLSLSKSPCFHAEKAGVLLQFVEKIREFQLENGAPPAPFSSFFRFMAAYLSLTHLVTAAKPR